MYFANPAFVWYFAWVYIIFDCGIMALDCFINKDGNSISLFNLFRFIGQVSQYRGTLCGHANKSCLPYALHPSKPINRTSHVFFFAVSGFPMLWFDANPWSGLGLMHYLNIGGFFCFFFINFEDRTTNLSWFSCKFIHAKFYHLISVQIDAVSSYKWQNERL